jgi:NAD(P)-dependent dehydrogenase (short-subunit alcohol dehydrogenase family)
MHANATTSPSSILITGCSSGIGHHCAHELARRGWQVIASARRPEDVARLEAEGLSAVRLDLDDPASIGAALERTLELTGGRLDALFNNGAYGQPGAVEDLSRDVLRAQLETNLLGWHDLTCRVIPLMRRQGRGRIVQNSSILGFIPLPYRGAYVASKYALEGLTDTLRLELRGSGISGLADRAGADPAAASATMPIAPFWPTSTASRASIVTPIAGPRRV